MKFLFLDTETTGLTKDSAVVQIAGIIEVDGEIKESFDIRCRPHEGASISEQALDVIGFTIDELNNFGSPEEALKEFESVLGKYVNKYDKNDKFTLVCHNAKFDYKMMKSFYERLENNYLGSWIDIKMTFCTLNAVRMMQSVGRFPKIENDKLETWCKHFGISLENAHDALEDIRATRGLFNEIKKAITE